MAHSARIDPSPIVVLTAVAVTWITVLTVGPDLGSVVYFVPLLLVGIGTAVILATHTMRKECRITAMLFMFVLFALNLSFRQREIGVTGLDWQNGVKLAAWTIVLALAWGRRHRIAPFLKTPLLFLMGVYAFSTLVSASWSETPTYTFASAIGLFAYLALACIVIIELGFEATLRLTIWTLAAYVALGIVGAIAMPDIAWLPPSIEETTYRLQGFSGHPNVFGQQVGILITLTAIAYRSKVIGFVSFLVLLTLGVSSIAATGSRTTIAAVVVAWTIIVIRDRHYTKTFLLAGMVAFAATLFAAGVGALSDLDEHLADLSRTGTMSEIVTLTGRTEVWNVVWSLILEKPFLGWGYNGTEDLISASMPASFSGTAVNAHNMVLQHLVSVGFLGTLPVFLLIVLLIIRFLSAPDAARDQVMVFALCIGMGEVGISASPVLLTLTVFTFLARDAERDSRPNVTGNEVSSWAMHSIPRHG